MKTHEITGIPDGYEPIDKDLNNSIRYANFGEFYLYGGITWQWMRKMCSCKRYLIIKKVEKPKTYRAFQNDEEFEPFVDRWIERINIATGEVLKGVFKVSGYDEDGVFLDHSTHRTYLYMYTNYKFKNGAPFGLEIT